MAFNENIDFWNNQTVADGQAMSAPLEKLLENDNYLKNKSDENEPKVFFAEYEITTFEEVTNALAANKMVFLRKIITVSEENHVIYLPLSNKKTSEPNVYTFSGISGHRGDLVISFTLSENDIWSFGNDSFPSKQIQVVAYGSTSLTDINSYFNKGLYLVCNRGNEYLPLIRRSLINDSYEYIFSGSYEDKVVKLKCEVSGWSEEVIGLKIIKDNAYDSVTDPINSDNITDIEQLTFIRNVGVDANYTMVESEKRIYGVLIPAPSLQADHGKVPMLNSLGQIVWETVPNEESVGDQISSAVQNLQTELTFDTTPTADSTNPVTSGGIKTALNAKQDAFNIVDEDASIAGSTATVSIEQGDLCIVDLSEETSLTAVEIVLTNNAEVAFPLWWFKIESGSAVTLSVKIGSVAVGWLGSAIANIALGKTIEVSVADGVACGGELV